jgi:hypothetical protein
LIDFDVAKELNFKYELLDHLVGSGIVNAANGPFSVAGEEVVWVVVCLLE